MKGIECDQVKIVGLPFDDSEKVKKAVIAMGSKIGLEIPPEAITSVRFSTKSADNSGRSPKLNAESPTNCISRAPDAFVSFKRAGFKDLFIGRLKEIKSLGLCDIGSSCTDNRQIHVYEVLTHDRHKLFTQLRREAENFQIQSIWHSNGVFYARKSSKSIARRVWDVGDLRKLIQ